MSDSQIKSVALFFLFIFFNENKTLQLTSKTLRLVQKKLRGRESLVPLEVLLVTMAQKVLSKQIFESAPIEISDSFQLPENISLERLQNLRKSVSIDEYSTLIWAKIIGWDEETLARGLGASVGTIRHRIATAFKTMAQQGGSSARS